MSKYFTIKKAAPLLRLTERRLRQKCESGELPGAAKERGAWQIPITASPKLLPRRLPISAQALAALKEVPQKKADEALRKLALVQEFVDFRKIHEQKYGNNRETAYRTFCTKKGLPKRTLQRYIAAYYRGAENLVDHRGIKTQCRFSEEAWVLLKFWYLRPIQLSVKMCRDLVLAENIKHSYGWEIPSLRACQQKVVKDIPDPEKILAREGMISYLSKVSPYIETDYQSVEPGRVWVGDHHQSDCWIRHRGTWIRPWITSWQDMRSRTQVGWHFSPGPNQTTILLAMKQAIEEYGPPMTAHIDNGRDFDSEMWTGTTKQKRRKRKKMKSGFVDEPLVSGIYASLGINISFAIPYNARSKPIERFFRTFEDQFVKTIPTYCGDNPATRPEDLAKYLLTEKAIEEAMTLEGFAQKASKYIKEVYNQASHTGQGMDGRSPIEVLNTRQSRRVLTEGSLEYLLRVWSGERVVRKNGVEFNGNRYGQYAMELHPYFGKKVRVGYDPDNVSEVLVIDAETSKVICTAKMNDRVPFGVLGEEQMREAMKMQRQVHKIDKQHQKNYRAAHMSLTDLAIEAKQAETKKVKLDKTCPTQKPVKTFVDGQLPAIKNSEKALSASKSLKATGTDDLDIDLQQVRRDRNRYMQDLEFGWDE